MVIKPFVHRCIIQSGSLAGNEHEQTVTEFDIEYGSKCDVCDEVLCTPEQAIAHIYGELTS